MRGSHLVALAQAGDFLPGAGALAALACSSQLLPALEWCTSNKPSTASAGARFISSASARQSLPRITTCLQGFKTTKSNVLLHYPTHQDTILLAARFSSNAAAKASQAAPKPASAPLQPLLEPLHDGNSAMINGRRVKVEQGQTILQAAASAGFFIPSICYHPRLPKSPGTCRVCLVNVDGHMRPSCVTEARPGQCVETDTEEVRRHVRGQLAFLRSNHPDDCMACNVNGRCEFQRLIDQYQVPLMPKTARIQEHAAKLEHRADFADPPSTPRPTSTTTTPTTYHTPSALASKVMPATAAASRGITGTAAAAAAAPAAAAVPATPQYIEGSGRWGEPGAIGGTCAVQVELDKCIKCGRCVTMCQDVQGMNVLGWVGRGSNSHVGVIEDVELAQSKCIECGQCVSVCPVGALVEAPHWRKVLELLRSRRKVMVVQTAPAVRVAIGEEVGMAPGSITTGQLVTALRTLGFNRVFDTNFSADLTIMEEGTELLQRLAYHWTQTSAPPAPSTPPSSSPPPPSATHAEAHPEAHAPGPLPMFTSCCPAWVADVEKRHPELLPHLSSCRSPQAMLGSVVKHIWARKVGIPAEDVVMVSIMPCVAKKHEAARTELLPAHHAANSSTTTTSTTPPDSSLNSTESSSSTAGAGASTQDGAEGPAAACQPDVDYVLTTRELGMMLRHVGVPMASLPEGEYDHPLGSGTGAAVLFGATGGVMEAALRTVNSLVGAPPLPRMELEAIRGLEGVREAVLPLEGPGVPGGRRDVRVAIASGIGVAEKLLGRMQAGEVHYDFVEVMACPGGCIGGGGQPKTKDTATIPRRMGAIHSLDQASTLRMSHENPDVQQLYDEALGRPGSHEAHELLHTHYTDHSKDVV